MAAGDRMGVGEAGAIVQFDGASRGSGCDKCGRSGEDDAGCVWWQAGGPLLDFFTLRFGRSGRRFF